MDFALHLPINSLSFGQVSLALLREFHALGANPALFPIGNPDVSAQQIVPEFGNWLNTCLARAYPTHKRTTPIIKLWHLNGSLESFSNKQILLSFYELDNPTREEINIVKNNHKVLFSSTSAKNVFQDVGCANVDSVNLGFDKHNFSIKNKPYHVDGRICFNLCGKLEKRKHTLKIISAWAKKYGNNPKFYLKCATFNPFIDPEQQKQLFGQALGGVRYSNIDFLGFMPQNILYNDFLNSGDIIIGMSGGEGWGLPEFQSVALGKHAVILNCSGYKDWATDKNSILVNPCGKIDADDGVFFRKGQAFNQGNIYDFEDTDFLNACDAAIERFKADKFNSEGIKLQTKFTYRQTAEKLLAALD